MKVNRLNIVQWDVEEHVLVLGRKGIGKSHATGSYFTEAAAIRALCNAKLRGNGATCIVRNQRGEGVACVLGIVKP